MKRTERRIDNTDCTIFSAMPTEGILSIKKEPLKTVDEFTHAWHQDRGKSIICAMNANYFNNDSSINGGLMVDGGFKKNNFSTHKDYTSLIYLNNELILDSYRGTDIETYLTDKYYGYGFITQLGPVLVKNNAIYIDDSSFGHASSKAPRTFIGQKADGTIIMFCTDGRSDEGFTIKRLQSIAIELGCKTAINCDGGGSSEMAILDEMVNENRRKVPVAFLLLADNFVLDIESDAKPLDTYKDFLNRDISGGIKFKDIQNNLEFVYLDRDIWEILGMKISYDQFLNTKILPNFTYREVACKQRQQFFMNEKAWGHALHIQQARTDLGFPFPINSWFRTFIYNRAKKVGSNDGSQHPLGLATDIRLTKAKRILFKAYWKLKGWGAIGLYWTFVHGDSRGFWKEWKG